LTTLVGIEENNIRIVTEYLIKSDFIFNI
jgi:hypothetical protein